MQTMLRLAFYSICIFLPAFLTAQGSGTPGQKGTGTGLQGVYHLGTDLTGASLISRLDSTINFEFTYARKPMTPVPGLVPDDNYSVRWTGQVQAQYSETYTFYTLSDDGIRLWVNGVLLVDNFIKQGPTEKSGSIAMVAGKKYDIIIEYFEGTGESTTRLYWSSPSTPKVIVPTAQLYPLISSPVTGTGLQAVYYNGTTLAGAPLLSRVDSTINFNLSFGNQPQILSPAPGVVPEDAFSVRWSGQVQPAFSETYTFSTSSDDGIRVWVNGVQLINDFTPGAVRDNSGSIALEANVKYDIVIEYFENNGNAVAALYWSSPSTPKAIIPASRLYPAACGLQAAYFNGITPTGTPLLTRVDSTINFDLAYGRQPQILSPAPGVVPDDKFSVRWTAQVQALYTERYTFSTLSDDGIRLWINGVLLVDNWVNQGATEKSGTIDMVAGQKYDLMVEYYDNSGDAIAKLYWASASTPKAIVPQRCLFPPIAGLLDRSIPSTPDTSSPPPPPVITTPLPISVSPNPAQTGKPVKLALYTETNTTASISIYDLQGHAVRNISIGLTKGNNSVTLDTYGLTAGLYIVRVNGIAQPFFGKLVLQ